MSSDQEASRADSRELWAAAMRSSPPAFDPGSWFPQMPAPMLVRGEDDVVLSLEDTLHCREQALLSAAYMAPELTPFADEDADAVVAVAKRFERYIRSGQ